MLCIVSSQGGGGSVVARVMEVLPMDEFIYSFVLDVSKDDKFCIKNEELCIKNEEFCIKNEELCIKNEESCVKNEEFCFKNDAFCSRTVAWLQA